MFHFKKKCSDSNFRRYCNGIYVNTDKKTGKMEFYVVGKKLFAGDVGEEDYKRALGESNGDSSVQDMVKISRNVLEAICNQVMKGDN